MSLDFVYRLNGVRDLKKILETTVKELGDYFSADCCQIMLSNPLDPNVTSICEFRSSPIDEMFGLPSVTMPLVLHGRTFGALSMSRATEVSHDEVNAMRVTLGELGDLIRHAQINDIVQRDTFRDTFLVEIGNLMAYSLGIGDALFMVVNILGKVLQASRCLFICTDDTNAGWKCYEFWQQDKVQSCNHYLWPTTDSPLVAQTLLSESPLSVFEGQQNSYVSPVQEELQFIGVKSLLGVALRSSHGTHGCVILQQCDYRRSWTRNEIDMVQNVADKVADALYKLPEEKRAREPIMQLHQRIVAIPEEQKQGKADYGSVRKSLKSALGQQAIPSARATSAPPLPPPPAKKPPPPPPTPTPAPPAVAPIAPLPTVEAAPAPGAVLPAIPQVVPVQPPATNPFANPLAQAQTPQPAQPGAPTFTPVQSRNAGDAAQPKSLGSILSAGAQAAATDAVGAAEPAGAKGDDPYADLDFGDFGEDTEPPSATPAKQGQAAMQAQAQARAGRNFYEKDDPDSTWGNLEAIQAPPNLALQPQPEPPAPMPPPAMAPAAAAGAPINQFETISPGAMIGQQAVSQQASMTQTLPPGHAPLSQQPAFGGVDEANFAQSVPNVIAQAAGVASAAPQAVAPAAPSEVQAAPPATAATAVPATAAPAGGAWGDLDSIQAPAGTPARAGLGGSMMGKARASSGSSQVKGAFGKSRGHAPEATVKMEALDEAAAEARVKQVAAASNETSDYIFATPGLDMRMLGRIDGWINQIEAKDKYANGHARQVAAYSVAIAKEAGLGEADVELVRQAAILHDLGKMPTAATILQKPDEELSDPELILVMKHPIDGAELLEPYPELKRLAPIVRAHHEEFNGNGYPQGLKGEEIPVAARIIHVANSYHNMTSQMRYGAGMKPTDAQQELTKGAGKQWDPQFVMALIQALMSNKVPATF